MRRPGAAHRELLLHGVAVQLVVAWAAVIVGWWAVVDRDAGLVLIAAGFVGWLARNARRDFERAREIGD